MVDRADEAEDDDEDVADFLFMKGGSFGFSVLGVLEVELSSSSAGSVCRIVLCFLW